MEKYCSAGQATEDNMAHATACGTIQSTNTHAEYVILIAFPLQQWLHESAPMVIRTLSCIEYTYNSN